MIDFIVSKENRSYWMGIAILWIIGLHVYQNTHIEFLGLLFGKGYLGVDVFFILSIFGLCHSYEKNTIICFYQNRLKRIFPLYFLYLFILFYCFPPIFPESQVILAFSQITGYANLRNYDIEWYIPALMCIYVSFPLLYHFTKYSLQDGKKWLSVIIVCVTSIGASYIPHVFHLFQARVTIIYVAAILFFCNKNKDNKSFIGYITLCACLFLFLGTFKRCTVYEGMLLPLILFGINIWRPRLLGVRSISFLGRFSLEIYLAQSFAIQYFAKYNPFALDLPVLYVTSILLIILLTLLFHHFQSIALNCTSKMVNYLRNNNKTI